MNKPLQEGILNLEEYGKGCVEAGNAALCEAIEKHLKPEVEKPK